MQLLLTLGGMRRSVAARVHWLTRMFDGLPRPGPGRARAALVAGLACSAFVAQSAAADAIVAARYVDPVDHYGHFALGRPHEYARLVATTESGRTVELRLPAPEVFEDLAPRPETLSAGGPTELLAIVSRRPDGARLVLIRLVAERLEISAESPAIGTPMRWLNPVGVADLDGDGQAEIAAVSTPHIGGTLRVYRRSGRRLVEVASLPGFSNHVYGSAELGLSAPVPLGGGWGLLVPDVARERLRIIALQQGRLVERGRCALPAPVTGAVRLVSPAAVSVGLATGPHTLALADCGAPGAPLLHPR